MPVIVRVKSVTLRIDHKEGQVLHVPHLVFGIDAQFGQWIEATRTGGGCRLEAEDFVVGVLLAPTGGELVELAFEVSDKHAFGPRKQGWDNQPNTFAAARGRVTQDMFGAVVPEVTDRSMFVAPGAHVDAVVFEQACGLDIAFVGPARGTVEKRVYAERAGQGENQK